MHNHAEAHLVRRQRNRNDDDDDDSGVQTVVSVRIITAANTYTGNVVWVTQTQGEAPKTLIAPAVRPQPTSAVTGGDAKQSSKPASSSKKASATGSDNAQNTAESTLMVATKPPTPSVPTAAAGVTSAAASISAAAAAGASDGGMSTGAKAGLALGILVLIGALLVGILLVYRRKKKAMAANDNEKIGMNNAPAPPPPQAHSAPFPAPMPVPVVSAPSIRTERSMSTAPRLSLRPVTQFDPAFENSKSGGNLLAVGAAAVPAGQSSDKDLPHRPTSSWERPGASNAPAENPFNDPQQASGPPSANPFGNNAALDASQARIPDSPPNASPLASAHPGSAFSTPAAPIPMPDVDPVLAATAMATVPAVTEDFPAPPSIKTLGDSVPASPAWTEDIPASPGPAPTGPPPVAGAIAGAAAGAAVGAAVAARPHSPNPPPNNVHRVQLDFKPSMQDELELNAGQLVRMLHEYDDGWALCIRMDRSQQGVVPRTCLSKHPVKPRTGPPRQGPPPPGMRGPPIRSPMGPGGIPQPRPLSPASGRMSPGPRSMSPGPRQMSPPQMQNGPRGRSNSNAPQYGPPRGRSNSNAPYAQPPRSMSPGPYGGGPQMAPPPQIDGRPRSNSASQIGHQQRSAPGMSPMNPNAPVTPMNGSVPARKPVPGMAM